MSANLALAKRDDEIVVTSEQLDLVKRTVAQGATDAELRLFLYDCQRRGVHPLDRLLHFTKRGGKYVPIVSIDLMRSRAADTGEYAGNDDAEFDGIAKTDGFSARVTVYRLVQGQRCAFSATARWSEYCPPAGQDTMWKKMPHTMLAKVAESLALRKGFPQQIGGLYSSEEMAQAPEDEQERSQPVQPKDESSQPWMAPPIRHPAAPDVQCEKTASSPQKPANPIAATMADLTTPKQLIAIRAIANANGLNAETVCMEKLNCRPEELSRAAASWFIDDLKSAGNESESKAADKREPDDFILDSQLYAITNIGKQKKFDIHGHAMSKYGKPVAAITGTQAAEMIRFLNSVKAE